jgi:hypothetical protein
LKDHKTNTDIAKALNITPSLEKTGGIQKKLVAKYKQNAS